jgi:hypothetical protein
MAARKAHLRRVRIGTNPSHYEQEERGEAEMMSGTLQGEYREGRLARAGLVDIE